MTGESTFTIHRYEIEVKQANKPVYIIPFGDCHRYAHLCDVKKWREFLEWAKSKSNAYFLGMGDYDDFMSMSERKALLQAHFHDETNQTIDDIYQDRTEKFVQEIAFMKGRIIGMLEGNHFGQFLSSNTSTTQLMCQMLKCKYLGVVSLIRLSFKWVKGNAKDRYCSIDICVHHGRGASRLIGGSINAVQQMIDSVDADCYLMAHDHKKALAMKTRLCLTGGGKGLYLSHRKILLGRTGSFLKGYVDGEPSYVAKGMMSPTDMGTLKIELTPKREQKDGKDLFYIDIHGSL